jgi:hypothetical protein
VAELVLAPILRHVGERDATVWVEADEACVVAVLGHKEPTFCVDGHPYALVCIEGEVAGSKPAAPIGEVPATGAALFKRLIE